MPEGRAPSATSKVVSTDEVEETSGCSSTSSVRARARSSRSVFPDKVGDGDTDVPTTSPVRTVMYAGASARSAIVLQRIDTTDPTRINRSRWKCCASRKAWGERRFVILFNDQRGLPHVGQGRSPLRNEARRDDRAEGYTRRTNIRCARHSVA